MRKLEEAEKVKFNKFSELLQAYVKVNLENYMALQLFIENGLDEKKKIFDSIFNEIDETEDIKEWERELQNFEKVHEESLFHFENEFPNRIRYYLIIQTQAVLEKYLKWFCRRISLLYNMPFEMDDLKGNSDMEKAKIYLSRIYNINFRDLEPEWSFLNNMRKLRNQIVHYNGHFTIHDKEVLKLIDIYPEVKRMWDDVYPVMEDDEEYEIEIRSKALNEKYAQTVMVFFERLLNLIKQKIEEA